MKKRILSLFLALVLVLTVLPAVSAETLSGACGEKLTWTLDLDTGELKIEGTGDMDGYGSGYPAPWHASGDKIVTVTICDGVTSIGGYAFSECPALTSVTIPDSVTSIEDSFRYCTGLTSVTIPGSVETVGMMAFIGCTGLKRVTIMDGVTCIDTTAFAQCSGIESLSIPGSVERICLGAFQHCTGLTSLTLEDGVTFVESSAFAGCTSLKSVKISGTMMGIGDGLFADCTGLTSVTIPVNTKEIRYGAFSNCTALTDVYYGGSPSQWKQVSIMEGNECLAGATIHYAIDKDGGPCGEMLTWEYADGVLTITGAGDMNDCTLSKDVPWAMYRDEITKVIVSEGCTRLGSLAFQNCVKLTSVTLPDSLKGIGMGSFMNCASLTELDLPENVTYIGEQAFAHCTSLQALNIPGGVTSIGFGMFINCDSLASVTLPDSVTSIGESAFYGCFSLTSIAIPQSVTDIDKEAFLQCSGLTDVYYGGTEAQWNAIGIGTDNECLTGANIHFAGSCAHEHASAEHQDATCTEAGYDRMICDDCHAILSEEILPALGHDFVNGVCTRCGAKEPAEQEVPGDLNGDGDVDAVDSIRLAKYLVGLVELSDEQIKAADVTGDGDVTATDAIRLAKYLVGLVETLRPEPAKAAPRAAAR